jgi:hypothetical protein
METRPSKVQGKKKHESTQPKGKTKANNQRKNKEKTNANKTHGYKMMINNNK